MIERKATTVELREDVYEDYNARLNDGMQDMLWEHENGGGGSYYINEHGRSTNTMPQSSASLDMSPEDRNYNRAFRSRV